GERVTRRQDDRAAVALRHPGGVGGGGQIAQHAIDHAGDRHRVGAGPAGGGDGEPVGDGAPFGNRDRAGLVDGARGGDVGDGHGRRVGGGGRGVLVVVAADRHRVDHRPGVERRRRGDAEGERLTRRQNDRAAVALGLPGRIGGGGQVAEPVVHDAGDGYR